MKYSLEIEAKTLTESARDNIAAALPASDDIRIDIGVHDVNTAVVSGDTYTIKSAIRFKSEADQIAVADDVLAAVGVLESFEPGTIIQLHDCTHNPNDPAGKCVVQTLYKVVP